jgi:hypothetical protein
MSQRRPSNTRPGKDKKGVGEEEKKRKKKMEKKTPVITKQTQKDRTQGRLKTGRRNQGPSSFVKSSINAGYGMSLAIENS